MIATTAGIADTVFLQDAAAGMATKPKNIPGKYLWDDRGSQLFDAICANPDYYPTRQEISLLPHVAAEVAKRMGANVTIVEFGAGASRKVRTLLDVLREPASYIALDISLAYVEEAVRQLSGDYPNTEFVAASVDYSRDIRLPMNLSGRPVLGFFPGNSIGNMPPHEARDLLERFRKALGPSHLLIGVDATRDAVRLHRAYQDPTGRMSAFHKNLLVRMNNELDADFDVSNFRHEARLCDAPFRSEAHLVALQTATYRFGEQKVIFEAGESLRTDWSHKYLPAEFQVLAKRSGWIPEQHWIDADGLFSMHLLHTC